MPSKFEFNKRGIDKFIKEVAGKSQDHMIAAVRKVEASHSGRPEPEVMDALAREMAKGGIKIDRSSEQMQAIARQISGGGHVELTKGGIKR